MTALRPSYFQQICQVQQTATFIWWCESRHRARYAGGTFAAVFPADVQSAPVAGEFPRALWAPQAPLALMVSIFAILAGVWLSYLFVVSRILAIRMGGKS